MEQEIVSYYNTVFSYRNQVALFIQGKMITSDSGIVREDLANTNVWNGTVQSVPTERAERYVCTPTKPTSVKLRDFEELYLRCCCCCCCCFFIKSHSNLSI